LFSKYKGGGDVLEVAQLAEESASCNDGKAYPKAPDDATEYGNNLMTEELEEVIRKWSIKGGGDQLMIGRTGGKEMMNKMAIGMDQPPGRLEGGRGQDN
jgi:hypothetical protein